MNESSRVGMKQTWLAVVLNSQKVFNEMIMGNDQCHSSPVPEQENMTVINSRQRICLSVVWNWAVGVLGWKTIH